MAAARMFVERHTLATVGVRHAPQVGRILCYHSVEQPEWGVNDLTVERFRQQLDAAFAAGFTFVPASQIAREGGSADQLAITFDDGALSVLTVAAPILRSYDIPFSAFVVSLWCGGEGGPGPTSTMRWDDVIRLAELGAEIGNHSASHADFADLNDDEIADQIGGARDAIERHTGIRTTSFAIPFGQSGNWPPQASVIGRELGYDLIYAQAQQTRPPGTIARTFVTHFDRPRIFRAVLRGRYDRWEEWF